MFKQRGIYYILVFHIRTIDTIQIEKKIPLFDDLKS